MSDSRGTRRYLASAHLVDFRLAKIVKGESYREISWESFQIFLHVLRAYLLASTRKRVRFANEPCMERDPK